MRIKCVADIVEQQRMRCGENQWCDGAADGEKTRTKVVLPEQRHFVVERNPTAIGDDGIGGGSRKHGIERGNSLAAKNHFEQDGFSGIRKSSGIAKSDEI